MQAVSRTKILFVVIDGIGDCPWPELGMKTPWENQSIPTLDKLALTGANGLMDSYQPGIACGSDTAHMSMFGYCPATFYKGRGAFETEGSGLEMNPGDIAFKCNFASMDLDSGIVNLRRVDRNFPEWGLPLISYLNSHLKIPGYPDHTVVIRHATEHRVGLRITGYGLSNDITDTDPLKDNKKLLRVNATNPEADFTAGLVQALSNEITRLLSDHPINKQRIEAGLPPANVILLRGCGIKLNLQPFDQKYRTKSAAICPTAIIGGLALTMGMYRAHVDQATGDYHTNLLSKAEKAYSLLYEEGYHFCFLHVKGFDESGHDKLKKVRLDFVDQIEKMLIRFLELVKPESADCVIAITGDHSTPMYLGEHSYEPVPVTISTKSAYFSGGFFLRDSCSRFSEIEAGTGILGRFCGSELMPLLFKISQRVSEKGHETQPPQGSNQILSVNSKYGE